MPAHMSPAGPAGQRNLRPVAGMFIGPAAEDKLCWQPATAAICCQLVANLSAQYSLSLVVS